MRGRTDVVWSSEVCAGAKEDFRFVSPDCSRYIVLFEAPRPSEPVQLTTVVANRHRRRHRPRGSKRVRRELHPGRAATCRRGRNATPERRSGCSELSLGRQARQHHRLQVGRRALFVETGLLQRELHQVGLSVRAGLLRRALRDPVDDLQLVGVGNRPARRHRVPGARRARRRREDLVDEHAL